MRSGKDSAAALLRWIVLLLLMRSAALAETDIWVTAYYAGWMQGWYNNGHLRAQDIDYGAVTHLVHFSLVPRADGTIDSNANSITPINSAELIARAHAAGKKVLISVGGWGSDVGFRGATSILNQTTFIANLVGFMVTRGYDGLDIDWEVLEASDASQFTSFIAALRTVLRVRKPNSLLTVATLWQPGMLARVHSFVDQINLMTYDMSGAWPGWITWHNAPIYNGGFMFPNSNRSVPSVDSEIDEFISAGVPAKKLGIGIDFYGYVWSGGSGTSTGGATEPRQAWTFPPTVRPNVPYHSILRDYFRPENYRWDETAQAAYLRMDSLGAASDKFVSFDDERTVQKKIEYVRSKKVGGAIIWELGGGYRPELPMGQCDALLQSVKKALFATTTPGTGLPSHFSLKQNYPNPFNPSTAIEFSLPEQAYVFLRIYNVLGERVAAPITRELAPGIHRYVWNAARLPSGTYFCRLDAWDGTRRLYLKTVRMLLLN